MLASSRNPGGGRIAAEFGHPRSASHRRALGLGRRLHRRPELRIHRPRSLQLALSLFALFVLAGLAAAPWGEWATGVIALLIVGQMLVGVGEELVCRGFLLVGARTRYSELGAFLFTCVVFGLMHSVNVLTGQALGPTLVQATYAAVLGAVFCLLRRTSGLLIVPILVHGLIDVVNIVHAPPG